MELNGPTNSHCSAKQRHYFCSSFLGAIQLSGPQRRGSIEILMLDFWDGGGGAVEMPMYGNVLEPEAQ